MTKQTIVSPADHRRSIFGKYFFHSRFETVSFSEFIDSSQLPLLKWFLFKSFTFSVQFLVFYGYPYDKVCKFVEVEASGPRGVNGSAARSRLPPPAQVNDLVTPSIDSVLSTGKSITKFACAQSDFYGLVEGTRRYTVWLWALFVGLSLSLSSKFEHGHLQFRGSPRTRSFCRVGSNVDHGKWTNEQDNNPFFICWTCGNTLVQW
jgi:hypothetical protein